jgi:hypothetical protein
MSNHLYSSLGFQTLEPEKISQYKKPCKKNYTAALIHLTFSGLIKRFLITTKTHGVINYFLLTPQHFALSVILFTTLNSLVGKTKC